MFLWTGFLLGFVGSFHCAAMCGPLVIAVNSLPGPGSVITRHSWMLRRLLYNFGRIATYALLGAISGLIGHTLNIAGLQQWLSLAAGTAILVALVLSSRFAVQVPAFRSVAWLKSAFARLLRHRSPASVFLLGGINGLLPCGLVYTACAGAIASGEFIKSVEYMLAFGLGTLPMMFGLSMAGRKLQVGVGLQFQRLALVSLLLMAALLLCRGLSLGVPYLSPKISEGTVKCPACAKTDNR